MPPKTKTPKLPRYGGRSKDIRAQQSRELLGHLSLASLPTQDKNATYIKDVVHSVKVTAQVIEQATETTSHHFKMLYDLMAKSLRNGDNIRQTEHKMLEEVARLLADAKIDREILPEGKREKVDVVIKELEKLGSKIESMAPKNKSQNIYTNDLKQAVFGPYYQHVLNRKESEALSKGKSYGALKKMGRLGLETTKTTFKNLLGIDHYNPNYSNSSFKEKAYNQTRYKTLLREINKARGPDGETRMLPRDRYENEIKSDRKASVGSLRGEKILHDILVEITNIRHFILNHHKLDNKDKKSSSAATRNRDEKGRFSKQTEVLPETAIGTVSPAGVDRNLNDDFDHKTSSVDSNAKTLESEQDQGRADDAARIRNASPILPTIVAGGAIAAIGSKIKGLFTKKSGAKVAEKEGTEIGVKVAEKEGAKVAEKVAVKEGEKMVSKTILKSLPIIGLLAGSAFAIPKLLHGDKSGAAMEVASGAASMIPGVGTAASLAMDGAIGVRDYKKAMVENAAKPTAKALEHMTPKPVAPTQTQPTVIQQQIIAPTKQTNPGFSLNPGYPRTQDNSFIRFQDKRQVRTT